MTSLGIHALQQHSLSSDSGRQAFVPPLDNAADKAGYIVLKDSKVVIFYTNNLLENPTKLTLDGTDDRAVKCVHGLSKLSCWMFHSSSLREKYVLD
jgi:hypothetical protein